MTAQSSRLGWPDEVSSVSARSPIFLCFPMFISRFSVRPGRSRWSLWKGTWVVVWLMKWRRIWGWRTEVESSGTRWSLGWMRKQRRTIGLWLRWSGPRHVVRLLRRAEEKLWEWVRNSVHQTCWIMHNKTMLMRIKALFRSVIHKSQSDAYTTLQHRAAQYITNHNRNDVNNMTGFAVLSYNMTMCSCGTGANFFCCSHKNRIWTDSLNKALDVHTNHKPSSKS